MPAAPAAPPAGVTIVDSPPPPPPPAPTTTIQVSKIAPTVEPPAPAKPGSAMDRLRQELHKKAKAPEAPATDTPPAPPADKAPKKKPDAPAATDQPPADPNAPAEAAPAAEPTAVEPGKPGKANPWKLVEQYKTKLGELEKQVAEAKTGSVAEQEKKQYLTQIETLQKRNAELEDEMRFVNFSKSDEFKTKYQEPYEKAWKRALSELSEIEIKDQEAGTVRKAEASDLMALIQLPLSKAREIADAVFGPFANDVMQHRKEIRALFESQVAALEEAKTKGAEREKLAREQFAKQAQEAVQFRGEVWTKANQSALTDETYGKFFSPSDGDQEGNQRLAKGFELVDRGLNENPDAPGLTKEQRASIIKRHAAIRNRAAAFGRLVHWLATRDAKIAALEKELEAFKETTPRSGQPSAPLPGESQPTSAKEAVFSALRKLAK